jgi:hypothetical protein
MQNTRTAIVTVPAILALALLLPGLAWAHCDALDGPVVLEARTALEESDITPVLKWVRAEDEAEICSAFDRALAVRKLGPEAREVADTYFFETLVRIHRAGEGAPFTGLKPAGHIEPVLVKADQALDAGSVDPLAQTLAEHTEQGLRDRFARAAEARRHAAESVQAGREYVEAYSTYVHYVEGLAKVVHGEHFHPGAER